MNLSDSGSSHLPISVWRSQFRAMVPSERSVIMKNANHKVAAIQWSCAASAAAMNPMGSRRTDMPFGWRNGSFRYHGMILGFFVVVVTMRRSRPRMARMVQTMIQLMLIFKLLGVGRAALLRGRWLMWEGCAPARPVVSGYAANGGVYGLWLMD